MTTPELERLLVEAMLRHLPPSGALLRLLDVNGSAGALLAGARDDLDITAAGSPSAWAFEPDSVDAVMALNCAPDSTLLRAALAALRPGGRLILAHSGGQPGAALVRALESAGYTRILVEAAVEQPAPVGVLMRGEKPPIHERTADRVRLIAARDDAPRAGRYVHLLVRQTPDKPAWALPPDEPVTWNAVAVAGQAETVLLAFSSLPKAIAFMQPAVLSGRIVGVNKVARFRWEVVNGWPHPVMLNPTDDILETHTVALLPVDPHAAEAPDE